MIHRLGGVVPRGFYAPRDHIFLTIHESLVDLSRQVVPLNSIWQFKGHSKKEHTTFLVPRLLDCNEIKGASAEEVGKPLSKEGRSRPSVQPKECPIPILDVQSSRSVSKTTNPSLGIAEENRSQVFG
jgi:hypothetical protein